MNCPQSALRPATLSAALLSCVVCFACAAPGEGDPGRWDRLPGDQASAPECSGAAPSCVASCGLPDTVGEATCKAGGWSCEAGVKLSVCCDPIVTPDRCPLWEQACSAGQECRTGYTCVKSRTYPVPSGDGVCRLGELGLPGPLASCGEADATPPDLLPLLDPGPAKVVGLLVIDYKCESKACPPDNACCQDCTGSYRLDLGDNDRGAAVVLPIQTESLSCAGTNCGLSCSPMQPGHRYAVWGTFLPAGTQTTTDVLYYMGHCEL